MTDYTGQENVVRLLVDNGADVNIIDAQNNTALIWAISEGIHSKYCKKKLPN